MALLVFLLVLCIFLMGFVSGVGALIWMLDREGWYIDVSGRTWQVKRRIGFDA